MQPVYRIMTKYQIIGNKTRGIAPFFQSAKRRVQSAKCSFCGGPVPQDDKKRKPQDDKEKKHRGDKKEGPRVTDL